VDAAAQRTSLGLGTAATANTGTNEGQIPVLGVGGKLALAFLGTPAQIMSSVGEQLIASLQVTRPANVGTAHFATSRAISATFTVKTSTGYARLINADGSLGSQVGTGVAGNNITLTIPASGLHRALGVLSVASAGSTQSGSITSITLNNHRLTTFSGTGLSSLTTLTLSNNQLTTFSGTGLSSLTTLDLSSNQLTTFSGTGMPSLTTLTLNYNQLTTFSGTGMSSLTTLYLNNNQFTTFSGTGLSSLTTLNLSNNLLTTFSGTGLSSLTNLSLSSNQLTTFSGTGLSSLMALYLNYNQLTTFSGTGLSSLTTLSIDNNQLVTLDCTALSLSSICSFTFNNLSAIALNDFFTSLGSGSGFLSVASNPGSATCNPAIATAKGYYISIV
jgi:DNA repair protein RadC